MKGFFRYLLFVVALLSWQTGIVRAQTLEGRVTLGDDMPAPFATVYVPSTGQGAVTDQDGRYTLDVPRGKTEVEFSYLGYCTMKRQLTFDEARTYVHDESLVEQAIMLGDVYVTPTGEDPAVYILRKVAERAAVNRKRLQHYVAQKEYVFHTQDIDFLPAILPKPINWALTSLMKLKHRGAIWEFSCDHEAADARLTSQMTFNRGDFSYHNEKLLSANPAMPDKAREQLFQMTHKDPFDKLYGDKTNYSMKVLKKGKCKYVLKGSIEENGQVINVLVNDQSGEGDDKGLTTLYVLEDNWCILRYEFTSKLWHERIECRNVAQGIYMPVSFLAEPTFESLDLEKEMAKFREKQLEKSKKGELSSSDRKFLSRMERYAQKHSNPRPSVATACSISYSNVQLAK